MYNIGCPIPEDAICTYVYFTIHLMLRPENNLQLLRAQTFGLSRGWAGFRQLVSTLILPASCEFQSSSIFKDVNIYEIF